MEQRMLELERRVKWLQTMVVALATLVILATVSAFSRSSENQVIRARGFVVVDSMGRARILIGAPIPYAADRVRTDTARVRKLWAGRFPDPDQYMRSYATYHNSMNGILILDSAGFDRLALGDPTPDPNVGRRIAPSVGLVINDSQGFERAGLSMLNVNRKGRVVLGLDSNRGREAVMLTVNDAGGRGLHVRTGQQSILLGHAFEGTSDSAFSGLLIKRGDSVVFTTGASHAGHRSVGRRR